MMYVPNMVNVPLLKEKNELRATVSISDYQFAYSATENIAFMLNGYIKNTSVSNSGSYSGSDYSTSRNLVEGGIGYFKPLTEDFIFETFVGGGIGKFAYNNTYNSSYIYTGTSGSTNKTYSANFTRYFVQPSIGYSIDFIDFAFSTRIIQLGFNNINNVGYSDSDLRDENLSSISNTTYYFIEPALTLRLGYKWGKVHMQAVYSNKINSEELNYQQFTMNVGLHINIAPRFNKSKNVIPDLLK